MAKYKEMDEELLTEKQKDKIKLEKVNVSLAIQAIMTLNTIVMGINIIACIAAIFFNQLIYGIISAAGATIFYSWFVGRRLRLKLKEIEAEE